jgi:hypothetical protein
MLADLALTSPGGTGGGAGHTAGQLRSGCIPSRVAAEELVRFHLHLGEAGAAIGELVEMGECDLAGHDRVIDSRPTLGLRGNDPIPRTGRGTTRVLLDNEKPRKAATIPSSSHTHGIGARRLRSPNGGGSGRSQHHLTLLCARSRRNLDRHHHLAGLTLLPEPPDGPDDKPFESTHCLAASLSFPYPTVQIGSRLS